MEWNGNEDEDEERWLGRQGSDTPVRLRMGQGGVGASEQPRGNAQQSSNPAIQQSSNLYEDDIPETERVRPRSLKMAMKKESVDVEESIGSMSRSSRALPMETRFEINGLASNRPQGSKPNETRIVVKRDGSDETEVRRWKMRKRMKTGRMEEDIAEEVGQSNRGCSMP